MICKTFHDHLLVSRLKNVQGQGSAGEQHDLEREQRKKGPRSLQYRGRAGPSGLSDCTPSAIWYCRVRTLTCRVAEDTTRAWNSSGKSGGASRFFAICFFLLRGSPLALPGGGGNTRGRELGGQVVVVTGSPMP